jgi:ABC-type Zn uptake system ZnuABC Zn-binding protein ZnuA
MEGQVRTSRVTVVYPALLVLLAILTACGAAAATNTPPAPTGASPIGTAAARTATVTATPTTALATASRTTTAPAAPVTGATATRTTTTAGTPARASTAPGGTATSGTATAGAPSTAVPAPSGPPLRVVATFSIVGDLVRNVGGGAIELTTLVGPDADVHEFEPSPADSARIVDAALIFENGLDLEPWLDDLYPASRSRARRVVVTEEVTARKVEGGNDEGFEFDPHVWFDVANAITMVGTIRDALVAANPANADLYRANADAYLVQLRELDRFVQEQVRQLPESRRKLVTSHDTFEYFAARYGFEIVGTALDTFASAASEPSAGEIAALVRDIRASGVPAIFAENTTNPGLMERVAREAGVRLAPGLYTDALGRAGSDGDTYVKMIRYDATTIVGALR